MTTHGHEQRKAYWREFYKHRHSLVPSQFCVLVASEIDSHATVVDLGSGNGKDSLYFAARGHKTIAMDLSSEAVKAGEVEAKARGLQDKMQFLQGDLSSHADVEKAVQIARKQSGANSVAFYCRFVLHSLDETEEDRSLSCLSDCMNPNEYVYFEFRAKEDLNRKKYFPNHYRRFLDTEAFQRKLVQRSGFSIEYAATGIGMAKYKEEDPVVSRVFARKA